MKTIMDENSITRTLVRMTHEIIEKNKGIDNLVLVGIKTGGETIAKRIAEKKKRCVGVDVLTIGFDIRYWRDDIDKTGITKPIYDLDLNHKIVVLIDDVLYKGRTVRAAMDGVMSFGRPQSIQLAVLVDRGHRELPIRADVVGKNVPTSTEESVKVSLQEVDGSNEVIILERND